MPTDPRLIRAEHRLAHQRRRAQRAEAELARMEASLDAMRAAIREERAALTAYLSGPEHTYDTLVAAETQIPQALRRLTKRHRTCRHCGGFTREALTDLLGPELAAMRDELGLPEPELAPGDTGTDWPVRPGAATYAGQVLATYRPTNGAQSGSARPWRPPHWHEVRGISDW